MLHLESYEYGLCTFSDFFVSSLSAEDEDLLERSASIKMIDFAHVWPAEVGSAEKYKKNLVGIFSFLLGTALSFVFYFKICSGDKTIAKFSEAAPDFAFPLNMQDELSTNIGDTFSRHIMITSLIIYIHI